MGYQFIISAYPTFCNETLNFPGKFLGKSGRELLFSPFSWYNSKKGGAAMLHFIIWLICLPIIIIEKLSHLK